MEIIKIVLYTTFYVLAAICLYKMLRLFKKIKFDDIKVSDYGKTKNICLYLVINCILLAVCMDSVFTCGVWIFNTLIWLWNYNSYRKLQNDLNLQNLNQVLYNTKPQDKKNELRSKKLQRIFKSKI
jgi:hypothetical protein